MESINKQLNDFSSDSDSSSDSNSDSESAKIVKTKSKMLPKTKSKSKSQIKKELKIINNIKIINNSEMDISESNDFVDNFTLDNDYFIINLRIKQRNSRKYTTTIENIPDKFLIDKDKLNNFLVKLRNAISSRATFKEENNIKFIEVSGNKTEIIIKLLCEYLNCTDDMIRIHGI